MVAKFIVVQRRRGVEVTANCHQRQPLEKPLRPTNITHSTGHESAQVFKETQRGSTRDTRHFFFDNYFDLISVTQSYGSLPSFLYESQRSPASASSLFLCFHSAALFSVRLSIRRRRASSQSLNLPVAISSVGLSHTKQ